MSTDLIFISYSLNDAQKALEVANRLKDAGANIWIDSINLLKIPSGEDPDDFTEAAIKSAKLFLIITSNSALKDESLKQEKECARENGVERLLLKIEACDTSKFRWKSLPTLELFRNEEEAYATLFRKFNIEDTNSNIETAPIQIRQEESVQTKFVVKEVEPEVPIKVVPIEKELITPHENVVHHKELLVELVDDFEVYKFNLSNQIRNGYIGFLTLIGISVILITGLYAFNGLKEALDYTQTNFRNLITIGGFLPSTFSTFSYSKIKEKQKRLQGVDFFDRQVSRMQRGLIPSTKQHIFDLEDEFLKYINT